MVADMNGDALLPIGDLARLTGLTVKTIRFHSDRGIVPPADRTPARRGSTAGIAPTSPQAAPVIKAITAEYAHPTRHDLLPLLETANDPRRRRYLRLLAVINSWPPPDNPGPAFTWRIEASASNNTADAPGAGRT
ncbi:MerR family DNA-binding transcriptional regulator [Streptomyces sp. NPDC059832]|uniref:helix-turn-helix domain-containing protein n=1 Tax=Streptomyces sp. NPDC059832 TaxID=3346966 RepID=UPI0036677BF5